MSTSPLTASAISARLRAAGCVFAEDEARLLVEAAVGPDELARMVERRAAGSPLEHILGWAEFCGLRIAVAPGVFVPRRRTESLVHEAVELCGPRSVVLDLCCGSGALGAAVSAAVPGIELYASDIEPAAVACARGNLGSTPVFEGDLFDALPAALRGRVDVLLCNTPYVPTGEIRMLPPEAREHEPLVTLDGGPDGLDVQRRVAEDAAEWLAPGGCVLVETSEHQAGESAVLFERRGLGVRIARSEEHDSTVVIATRALLGPIA
jgi:release factor glutamine methyltransferase